MLGGIREDKMPGFVISVLMTSIVIGVWWFALSVFAGGAMSMILKVLGGV